ERAFQRPIAIKLFRSAAAFLAAARFIDAHRSSPIPLPGRVSTNNLTIIIKKYCALVENRLAFSYRSLR
ncbi:hypothetical protein LK538_24870, partial [Serratia marcescens]